MDGDNIGLSSVFGMLSLRNIVFTQTIMFHGDGCGWATRCTESRCSIGEGAVTFRAVGCSTGIVFGQVDLVGTTGGVDSSADLSLSFMQVLQRVCG